MSKATREYRFREGRSHKIGAEVIGCAIEKIRLGGDVTPPAIVEHARPEGHPLHPGFTWDDAVAGVKCRLQEAQDLMTCYVIVDRNERGEEFVQIANISVVSEDGNRSYQDSIEALSSEEVEAQLCQEAYGVLEGFCRRYTMVHSLSGVVRAIRKILAKQKELVS